MTFSEVIFLLFVGATGTLIGWIVSAKFQKNKIIGAERSVASIIERAKKEAKTIEKEILVEAKDASFKMKSEVENQLSEKSKLMQDRENSLNQRELGIDRKSDLLDKKESNLISSEEDLDERSRLLKKKDQKFTELIEDQNIKLANISKISQEEAKEILMKNLMEKARQDSALKVKEIKDESIRTAVLEAKKIIVSAIQRCAADHSSENSVSVVHLPSDSMKGRIIGREGRNIRSFESITGIEVIIDDTPEAVVISGFDPVRREIARLSLETLVTDGRIHPARIEEVVKKTKEEINEFMKVAAENSILELNIPRPHDEIMKLLGRMNYRTSYGQNVLKHSVEVGMLAGLMAAELSLDGDIAKISGLLHDIGKVLDKDTTGPHAITGANVVRKYIDDDIIINAIESHHEEVEMTNPISALVQSADSISGARRGARGDTLEAYIKRMTDLEKLVESFRGVSKSYAIQAGREIRVVVENDQVDDASMDALSTEISDKIQSELTYPGQIKVVLIREQRSVSIAK